MLRYSVLILIFFSASVLAQSSLDWVHDKQRGSNNEELIDLSTSVETQTWIKPSEQVETLKCQADIAISYFQKDTRIEVETEISNEECGASYGKYKLKIKTRNESGEITTTNYQESWSRDDANTVQVVHNYDMNGDIDLISVRARASSNDFCTCKVDE